MNIRLVQEDFQLELEVGQTVNLRKGDFVALYPPTLHRDPEVFEDPEVKLPTDLVIILLAQRSFCAFVLLMLVFLLEVISLLPITAFCIVGPAGERPCGLT